MILIIITIITVIASDASGGDEALGVGIGSSVFGAPLEAFLSGTSLSHVSLLW
jgi:hypothetical protein